jgi:DNA mismatch repair protein MutS
MCGVPAHSSERYLLDLIKKGFRVAVCEQMESPIEAKKRGYKAVVKRDVVRLVTPGTLTEESLLEPHSNNYLMAFSEIRNDGAIAWLDMSTGELRTTSCPKNMLSLELSRISPSELILSESHAIELEKTVKEYGISISPLIKNSFESQSTERRLLKHYNVASLESFGEFSRVEISAMGALIEYLDLTQKGNLPYLHIPIKEDGAKVLKIDPATRKNLELVKNLNGTREGSLLSIINKTNTSSGARLIERWLSSPSTDLNLIQID